MFWKTLKWGGSIVFVLLLIVVALLGSQSQDDNGQTAAQPQPQQSAPGQPGKKFNF